MNLSQLFKNIKDNTPTWYGVVNDLFPEHQYLVLQIGPVLKTDTSHDAKKFVQPLKFQLSWYSLNDDGSIE